VEGGLLSIAKHLLKDTRRGFRTLLLGETKNVHFHTAQGETAVVYVPNLTQTQWRTLVRLLTGRASFCQRWLQRQSGFAELCLREPSDLGKTK
jgi:hypothetical protein